MAYIARKNNCRAERSVVIDDLVYLKNEQAVCDSLQVAEKFEMRHDNVLRAIDNLQKSLLNFEEPSKMFVVSKRKADDGQYHKMYLMNRDGFSLLVMGFTGKNALEWKLQYIRAFKQMENFIREKSTQRWIETRKAGKFTRKVETDAIQNMMILRWWILKDFLVNLQICPVIGANYTVNQFYPDKIRQIHNIVIGIKTFCHECTSFRE